MPRFNSSDFTLYRFIACLSLLAVGILARAHFLPAAPLFAGTSAYLLPLLLTLSAAFHRTWRVAALLTASLCLGIWRADMQLPLPNAQFSCTGQWQVQDFPQRHLPIGQRLSLKPIAHDCAALRGQAVQATTYQAQAAYQIGDRFSATLHIRSGKRHYYSNLPNQLAAQTAPLPLIIAYRQALAQRIDHLFAQQAAWVRALIIGDRSRLSASQRQQLQHSGTSHLLAISGLHLAVMMALFYWLGKAVGTFSRLRYRCEPRSLALCSALLGGLAFTLLSGAQAPILRAWLMFACLLLLWFNLPIASGLIALGIALFIILILEPTAIFSLSTWLSFLATAAVIILMQRLHNLRIWQQWLALQTGISLALLPLIWSVFGGISWISIAVNLIIIPWLGVLLCLLLAALVLSPLVPLASTFLSAYLRPIELAAALPLAYSEPLYQPPLFSGSLLSLACLCLFARKPRLTLIISGLACAAALIPFWQQSPYLVPNARLPNLILYPPQSAPLIINTGYHYRERNDAKRYLIPQLRHRAARPQAIIISHNSRYSSSGINTLLSTYPNTPIYSLVPLPNLAFPYQYCPELPTNRSFHFSKQGTNCRLHIGEQSFSAADIIQQFSQKTSLQTAP